MKELKPELQTYVFFCRKCWLLSDALGPVRLMRDMKLLLRIERSHSGWGMTDYIPTTESYQLVGPCVFSIMTLPIQLLLICFLWIVMGMKFEKKLRPLGSAPPCYSSTSTLFLALTQLSRERQNNPKISVSSCAGEFYPHFNHGGFFFPRYQRKKPHSEVFLPSEK